MKFLSGINNNSVRMLISLKKLKFYLSYFKSFILNVNMISNKFCQNIIHVINFFLMKKFVKTYQFNY
jgi:hypothetical protein